MEKLQTLNRINGLRYLILGLPLFLLPLVFGGARPWLWAPVAGIFTFALVILTWSGHDYELRGEGPLLQLWAYNRWFVILLPFLFYPFLQVMPLPMALVELLSPHRAWWIKTASNLSGLPDGAATLSYGTLTTLFQGLWWLFLAIFALLFRQVIRSEKGLDLFLGFLFVVVFFESLYGLLQVLSPNIGVLWDQDSSSASAGIARGTFINRNHYAAFLGMIWPVLLAYVLGLKNRPEHKMPPDRYSKPGFVVSRQKTIFLVFIIAMVLLGLIFSLSRGGIVGALVAITVLVAFGRRTQRRGLLISFVGCWLIVLSYGAVIGFDGIVTRFEKISDEAPGRFEIWKDSWHIVEDHPFTGVGLGNNALVYDIYQSHLPESLHASHAHNDYLQLAVELGFPAALAISLLVWGYWLRTAWVLKWKSVAHNFDQKRSMVRLGALAGSAAFLSHSWIEFNWQIPANQLYFIVLLVLMGMDSK